MSCEDELRAAYRGGYLLPFIGAGVSMSVTWQDDVGHEMRGPSWTEFVNKATELLGASDPDFFRFRGSDLQILEYYRMKTGNTQPLTNWFLRTFEAPDYALQNSQIHAALASLQKCSIFYTTNFDNYFERSLRLNGRKSKAVVTEAHMGRTIGDAEVIKFHGDWDHPEAMVVTEADYEKRLKLSTALDWRLLGDALGRVILFIGYSFRDPNVSYLLRFFHELHKEHPEGNARAYIFVADPSDFERTLFRSRKMEIIPINGADMTAGVVQMLERITSE